MGNVFALPSSKDDSSFVSSKRNTTVPKGPKLRSQSLRGDRTYSTLGKREEDKRVSKVNVFALPSPKDDSSFVSSKRNTTVPKGPKLRTQSLHGDRTYSSLGKREEDKRVSNVNVFA